LQIDPFIFVIVWLGVIFVILSVLQSIFSGIRFRSFKRESDFRKLIPKLYEEGYPSEYNDVKKEITLKVNPDIEARVVWKNTMVQLFLKATRRLDSEVKERLERDYRNEIEKVIDRICRGIKLGDLLNLIVIVGSICGIIALIIALSQLWFV
jgi:hypothetical protein